MATRREIEEEYGATLGKGIVITWIIAFAIGWLARGETEHREASKQACPEPPRAAAVEH